MPFLTRALLASVGGCHGPRRCLRDLDVCASSPDPVRLGGGCRTSAGLLLLGWLAGAAEDVGVGGYELQRPVVHPVEVLDREPGGGDGGRGVPVEAAAAASGRPQRGDQGVGRSDG